MHLPLNDFLMVSLNLVFTDLKGGSVLDIYL